MKTRNIQLAAAAFLLSARFAAAGLVMEFETRGPKDDKPETGSVYLESDRLRTETARSVFIYRGDKQALWILEPGDKSYMEINKESMAAMAKQLAAMQEQLKNLPPEMRAKMDAMMGGQMGGGAPPEPRTYQKGERSEEINGFPCTLYEARRAGKKEQELWVTDWKKFDIKAADFAAFGQMAEFVKSLTGPFAKSFSSGFAARYGESERPDALPGVPIRSLTFSEGGSYHHEVKKLGRAEIPADKFEIPEGYKKKEMMSGPMGAPRR